MKVDVYAGSLMPGEPVMDSTRRRTLRAVGGIPMNANSSLPALPLLHYRLRFPSYQRDYVYRPFAARTWMGLPEPSVRKQPQ